ncbi:MAG: sensor histidine kinase [Vicinamibacterales bacterium]
MLTGAPDLLHVVGYLTGATLYAMLLMMALGDRSGDRLTLGTGVLGLAWNVGELGVYALRSLHWYDASAWVSAASFGALGFLAALVVHSVSREPSENPARRRSAARGLNALAYGCAATAAVMHLGAAVAGRPVPVPAALVLLTVGLVALAPALVLVTRAQAHGPRAIWMTALAVFAVSALHLGNFHGTHESFAAELLGHHASIPLAFAILYQDYRFALADLFLKHALTLIALVALVVGGWSLAMPMITAAPTDPRAIAVHLALWATTALVFPSVRRAIGRFVDLVVLKRADYGAFVDDIASLVQQSDAVDDVLSRMSAVLAPALSATEVTWTSRELNSTHRLRAHEVPVRTTDAPQYVLVVGRLAGGRRLLSDDLAMLERVALLVARRIDALRLTEERYERRLRDREMRTLATEAELKALRAQINPHFLFNALTTIGYLIQVAPARAFDTLMRLTTILRSVLRSDGEFTTLRRERELINSYLQIEQERFEERLEIRLEIPDELADCQIPALIVQPLVENAIKHGIAPARSGGLIRISADTSLVDGARALRIAVLNTGAPFVGRLHDGQGGVGLENVERRLACYYGTAARLDVRSRDDGATIAELHLPVTDLDHAHGTLVTRDRVAR